MKNILKYLILVIIILSLTVMVCSCSDFSDSDVSKNPTIDCNSEAENKSDINNESTVDSTHSGEDALSSEYSVITSEQPDPPTSYYPPPNEEDTAPAVPTDERDYEIMYNYELDKCYMVFYDASVYEGNTGIGVLSFSSIEIFLDEILNGNISAYNKKILVNAFPKSEVGFEICDLKNLYYPAIPDGILTSHFMWYGKHYSFSMKTESGDSVGYLDVYDKETFNEIYERSYVNAPYNASYKDVVSKVIDGTDIVGKYFYSKRDTLATLQYELKTEEKTIYVQKNYFSDNEDIPANVELFCIEGDKYYFVRLYVGLKGLEEDLTNDWLLSFSIEPYSK